MASEDVVFIADCDPNCEGCGQRTPRRYETADGVYLCKACYRACPVTPTPEAHDGDE